jgi:hypothetical protein
MFGDIKVYARIVDSSGTQDHKRFIADCRFTITRNDMDSWPRTWRLLAHISPIVRVSNSKLEGCLPGPDAGTHALTHPASGLKTTEAKTVIVSLFYWVYYE